MQKQQQTKPQKKQQQPTPPYVLLPALRQQVYMYKNVEWINDQYI